MSSKLRLLALAATLIVPAALSGEAMAAAYLDRPDAPLVGPTVYATGNPEDTAARQQASGYFAAAGAPLVAPTEYDTGGAAASLARQSASGYFPEAGAPLVSATTTVH
jgi:hypothetical protein